MTKFSNKFKKPCFWPIFGPLSTFLGQKDFLKKIWSCLRQNIWPCYTQQDIDPQHHAEFQKKLMSQSQENFQRRTQGRTLIHWTLPARTRGPKIAMWAFHDEQIINYEWPYDHGANASEPVQKISKDQKEYCKCSKCNLLNSQNILSINNSWKRLVTRTPPTQLSCTEKRAINWLLVNFIHNGSETTT